MVHSRLSIQPRSRPRPMAGSATGAGAAPRRCADAFEASLRGGAPAPERVACAVASAAARVKYDFDFAKGVWAVRDTGAVVIARDARDAAAGAAADASRPASETRERNRRARALGAEKKNSEASPETRALAEATRARAWTASPRGTTPHSRRRRRSGARTRRASPRRRSSARAAQVPLPKCPGAKERRFARREPRDAAGASPDADAGAGETDAARWRMLRLRETGDVVFFDAPDACEALVQAWLSGETPWPEIRVMELSREARAAGGVPPRRAWAGGPGGARRGGGGGAPAHRRGGRPGEAGRGGGVRPGRRPRASPGCLPARPRPPSRRASSSGW